MAEDGKNEGRGQQAVPPPGALPSIQEQLIINWHGGNRITANIPKNPQLAMLMIAQALVMYAGNLEFKESSPIIQVPPGTKVRGGG